MFWFEILRKKISSPNSPVHIKKRRSNGFVWHYVQSLLFYCEFQVVWTELVMSLIEILTRSITFMMKSLTKALPMCDRDLKNSLSSIKLITLEKIIHADDIKIFLWAPLWCRLINLGFLGCLNRRSNCQVLIMYF